MKNKIIKLFDKFSPRIRSIIIVLFCRKFELYAKAKKAEDGWTTGWFISNLKGAEDYCEFHGIVGDKKDEFVNNKN